MGKNKTTFNLNSKFTFGKYKDKEIESIIIQDPSYVIWCKNNVKFFELSDKAKKLLKKHKPIRSSGSYGDPGEARGAANQGMVDVFGGSGMDGGWGSNPFG